MKKCDVCGKGPIEFEGVETFGILMRFDIPEDATPEQIAFCQNQLGPYQANRDYRVCRECMLRTFGVKPEDEKEIEERGGWEKDYEYEEE